MKAIQELRSLLVAERIQLVEDLWDSIAEDSGSLPLTDSQLAELDLRLDYFEAALGAGDSWEEVKRKLQRKP